MLCMQKLRVLFKCAVGEGVVYCVVCMQMLQVPLLRVLAIVDMCCCCRGWCCVCRCCVLLTCAVAVGAGVMYVDAVCC